VRAILHVEKDHCTAEAVLGYEVNCLGFESLRDGLKKLRNEPPLIAWLPASVGILNFSIIRIVSISFGVRLL
jgi:hypothetical protein